mmetsp:Transcript_123648/g.395574  ORF Transcript_123648/g.395574 Transcript_123648/m.395574 type:complete len:226 (-) Transcript_123648:157-834(-)
MQPLTGRALDAALGHPKAARVLRQAARGVRGHEGGHRGGRRDGIALRQQELLHEARVRMRQEVAVEDELTREPCELGANVVGSRAGVEALLEGDGARGRDHDRVPSKVIEGRVVEDSHGQQLLRKCCGRRKSAACDRRQLEILDDEGVHVNVELVEDHILNYCGQSKSLTCRPSPPCPCDSRRSSGTKSRSRGQRPTAPTGPSSCSIAARSLNPHADRRTAPRRT